MVLTDPSLWAAWTVDILPYVSGHSVSAGLFRWNVKQCISNVENTMRKHWDSTDEEAYREAKALEKATANEIRRRASHARHEELMPGLEQLEHHAAVLCGDIEFFGKAGVA